MRIYKYIVHTTGYLEGCSIEDLRKYLRNGELIKQTISDNEDFVESILKEKLKKAALQEGIKI